MYWLHFTVLFTLKQNSVSNKGEIRVKLILLIYVISCALSTLPTRVKTTIRKSPSRYFCASDILIFWVRFLLSSNSFFTENVSKVKMTSIQILSERAKSRKRNSVGTHRISTRSYPQNCAYRDTLRWTKYNNISVAKPDYYTA